MSFFGKRRAHKNSGEPPPPIVPTPGAHERLAAVVAQMSRVRAVPDGAPSRVHLWLYIEEPYLDIAPGTDLEQVRRTGIPSRRLAPDRETTARQAVAELHSQGWIEVDVIDQYWDDHPQVGSAWWISLEGVPPVDSAHGMYDARTFIPRPSQPGG